jgi:hypothetical protein
MATTQITNIPELVTVGDTSENVLQFAKAVNSQGDTVFITIVNGTFKFNVFGLAALSNATYTAGDTVAITHNGFINYKATATGSFKITA